MNRFASGLLAASFLAGSAGFAFAADAPATNAQPHQGMPMAAMQHQRTGREGERMTSALNALEANGYGDFSNFHQDGQNFAATVSQNGQQFNVVVNPDTHQVTRQG